MNLFNEVKKIDSRIQKLNIDIGDVSEKLCQIEKENPWILSEKHMIGKDDVYNFDKNFDIKKLSLQYYRMKEENEKLRTQVNTRVDQMSDQADQ